MPPLGLSVKPGELEHRPLGADSCPAVVTCAWLAKSRGQRPLSTLSGKRASAGKSWFSFHSSKSGIFACLPATAHCNLECCALSWLVAPQEVTGSPVIMATPAGTSFLLGSSLIPWLPTARQALKRETGFLGAVDFFRPFNLIHGRSFCPHVVLELMGLVSLWSAGESETCHLRSWGPTCLGSWEIRPKTSRE